MKAKITNFVTAKKELAVASGKAYATEKGKEVAFNSINAVMATPQFQKLDDLGVKTIHSGLDFAMNKLDKVEAFNKKTTAKTISFLDKVIKALLITGVSVAGLGIIGGTVASFLTGNFLWMILTAFSIVALGAVLVAGIDLDKAEEVVEHAIAPVVSVKQEAEVLVATTIAEVEEKLPKLTELKAA